jgi:hypothetical protein
VAAAVSQGEQDELVFLRGEVERLEREGLAPPRYVAGEGEV